MLGNETYGLEPLPKSVNNDHILYRLRDIESEPVTCGVIDEAESTHHEEPFHPAHTLTSLLRVSLATLITFVVTFQDGNGLRVDGALPIVFFFYFLF